MTKYKQPDGLLPGIYFNLEDEVYHSDKAFSHSGMRKILTHPYDYWHSSPLNSKRSFKVTEAMQFGKMCHMYLLQPEKFFDVYSVPGMGYSPNRKLISRADFAKIEEATEMLRKNEEINNYFQNGFAEVSIFWICPRTGIRLRMRVDYLRTFGIIDLKRNKDIEDDPLGWAIESHGYDMQDELYKQGLKEIRKMLRDKTAKVYGCPDKAWLKKFIDNDEVGFVFLFQRSVSPYVFRVIEFEEDISDNARVCIDCAIDRYVENIEKYGENEWPAGNAKPEKLGAYQLPRKVFNRASRYAMGDIID
jgi:hypothetical protein